MLESSAAVFSTVTFGERDDGGVARARDAARRRVLGDDVQRFGALITGAFCSDRDCVDARACLGCRYAAAPRTRCCAHLTPIRLLRGSLRAVNTKCVSSSVMPCSLRIESDSHVWNDSRCHHLCSCTQRLVGYRAEAESVDGQCDDAKDVEKRNLVRLRPLSSTVALHHSYKDRCCSFSERARDGKC